MDLKLKAYKCCFPDLYDYTDKMWIDQYEVIYGITQKEAVKNRCSLDEMEDYWTLKKSIRTRRFPEKDFYEIEKDSVLENLSKQHIQHLTHSLGVQLGDKCPEKFYRNRSVYYEKNEKCDELVSIGLMENWQKFNSEVYGVTTRGIEAVKTLLLVNKL